MAIKELTLHIDNNAERTVPFEVKHLIKLGYTGRDQIEVEKHVAELKKIGAVVPECVPNSFVKSKFFLTMEDECEVLDTDNSGEAEFVLLVGEKEIYVGVGSDHTDRYLNTIAEAEHKSKHVYPSFLSQGVWKLSDIQNHWDEIIIRSWIGKEEKPYQEAKLSTLLPPDILLQKVKEITGINPGPGTVIYGGTISTLSDVFFGSRFKVELYDGIRKQSLTCQYDVTLLSKRWTD